MSDINDALETLRMCQDVMSYACVCSCMQVMQHIIRTYTLSAVTFRMSMTSHSPEVIAVVLPCMNESEQNVCGWATCYRRIFINDIVQCVSVRLCKTQKRADLCSMILDY